MKILPKTRKKAGMLFSANFDRRRTNPLIYVKFWKKACISALLFGAELWTVTKTGLDKLERCQKWFLKKHFYLPDYIESSILYIISGLQSISTLLHQKRLYFLGRIISLKKIPKVVSDIFRARLQTLDDNNSVAPQGFLGETAQSLKMFDLTSYLLLWQRVLIFPTYRKWKQIVNYRIFKLEREAFAKLSLEKPIVDFILSAFSSCTPCKFWALTSINPDLVPKFQTQLRLLVNAGLQGGPPWLRGTRKDLCPLCKLETEDNCHFLFKRKIMKPEWNKFWSKLFNTIQTRCEHEASIANGFINNLSHSSKVLLLTGSLVLPFQKFTNDAIRHFVAVSVHKVIKIRKRLVEKGKPKLDGSSVCFSALARWFLDANLSLHHLLT